MCKPSGACTYTADSGYRGTDGFSYTVSDGASSNVITSFAETTGNVAITVTAQSTGPQGGNGNGSGNGPGFGTQSGGGSNHHGSLPFTGGAVGLLALIALAFVGTGTAALASTRRRRRVARG